MQIPYFGEVQLTPDFPRPFFTDKFSTTIQLHGRALQLEMVHHKDVTVEHWLETAHHVFNHVEVWITKAQAYLQAVREEPGNTFKAFFDVLISRHPSTAAYLNPFLDGTAAQLPLYERLLQNLHIQRIIYRANRIDKVECYFAFNNSEATDYVLLEMELNGLVVNTSYKFATHLAQRESKDVISPAKYALRESITHPEITALRKLVQALPHPFTFIFDMKGLTKEWKFDFDFVFLRDDHYRNDFKPLRGNISTPTQFSNMAHHCFDVFYNQIEADVFAWAPDSVDSEAVLYYDTNPSRQGFYAYVVWEEEPIAIGQNLSDIFFLPKTISPGTPSNIHLVKSREIKTWEQVLHRKKFEWMDFKWGYYTDFAFYKNFIDETIIPLTNKKLQYTELSYQDIDDERLALHWQTKEKTYTVQLDKREKYFLQAHSFYTMVNEVLQDSNTAMEFVFFRGEDFGTQYILACVDTKTADTLKYLPSIELFKD
ncbi:hypothetical protein LX64_02617 [Chitinophaga skermanii]|uniref:Uncharacterized protein n=1 Tax=Chitinophaga skermanii TaxID=331697 RepID=A0A327QLM9_9BACT|nr:hypothetical protein [Chitinophaga skermanii]RAJ05459.1 hypothetical protein LX64_02617 [Chitinophaga skermanii]